MELIWYGLGCFRVVERGYPALVTDPFNEEETGLVLPRVRAEIVTSSMLLDEPQATRWKGLRSVVRTLAGPGEYEIGGLFVTGIATSRSRNGDAKTAVNVVYSMNCNGVVVCHLGEVGVAPTQTQIELMGDVNILLMPVGIPGGLTPALASEIVSLVEPDIVVPMNYATDGLLVPRESVVRFLKEMGIAHANPVSSLKITAGEMPEETQVVLLEPQKG